MNQLQALMSRGRVKMLIETQGRVYRPPRSDVVTINGDGIGLRIVTDFLSLYDNCALVGRLDYTDEECRTIDSVLVSEADTKCGYPPVLIIGDEVSC